MAVTRDIMRSYWRPRSVFRRLLDAGPREDRAIAILAGACLVFFVASWPRLARQAQETGEDLTMLLAYAMFTTLFMMPLLFYAIAAIARIVAKIFRGRGTWYTARLALFWSLLATTPILLLWGLTQGFIGPGGEADALGLLWFATFLLFWSITTREAERG